MLRVLITLALPDTRRLLHSLFVLLPSLSSISKVSNAQYAVCMIEDTYFWELNCQGQSRKCSKLMVSSHHLITLATSLLPWTLVLSISLLTQYTASPTGRDIADTSITGRRQPYLEVMPASWASLNAGQPGVPILMRFQWTSSPRQMGEIFWRELCSPSSFSFLSHCSWVKLVFLLVPPFVIILHREGLLFLVGT